MCGSWRHRIVRRRTRRSGTKFGLREPLSNQWLFVSGNVASRANAAFTIAIAIAVSTLEGYCQSRPQKSLGIMALQYTGLRYTRLPSHVAQPHMQLT